MTVLWISRWTRLWKNWTDFCKMGGGKDTAQVRTVNVRPGAGASYDIHIGRFLLARVPEFCPLPLAGRSLFVVTDDNAAPYAETICESLKSAAPRSVAMLVLPAGEGTKSFAALEKTVGWMLDNAVDRESVLFAVGGGVIGDLAGFAASIVMRGIRFVQVPTTLLAQVDSSVGGKTGIDMPQGKNLAGTFWQPCAVIADTQTLETLPRREILAGYAEIVKYGLIDDPEFFCWLEKAGGDVCALEPAALDKAIEKSCRAKAEIVAADEREKGVRALLNLGHTFAHALESAAGYDGTLLHGEAVSVGMVLAFRLSERLGLCPAADADRVEAHLAASGLPVRIAAIGLLPGADARALAAAMKTDKKAAMGRAVFVVANGIGKAHLSSTVPMDDVIEILKHSSDGK